MPRLGLLRFNETRSGCLPFARRPQALPPAPIVRKFDERFFGHPSTRPSPNAMRIRPNPTATRRQRRPEGPFAKSHREAHFCSDRPRPIRLKRIPEFPASGTNANNAPNDVLGSPNQTAQSSGAKAFAGKNYLELPEANVLAFSSHGRLLHPLSQRATLGLRQNPLSSIKRRASAALRMTPIGGLE